MKRKTEVLRSTGMGFVLVIALILTLVLSFTNISVAGGKPDFIRTGYILDLTGPYAPITGPVAPGTIDAWKYINAELGGVRGVKVEPVIRDFAGKMPLALSAYNELINMDPKPLFFLSGSSTLAAALRERFKEDNVIGMSPTSVDSIYPVANTFGIYPLYAEMLALGVKYIKDNWKENRRPKVGIITWDTGYGRAVVLDEFYAYIKGIGVDHVGTELFGIREQDATSQLLRLRAKKADWLITNTTVHGPTVIKKGCKAIDWDVKLLNTIGGDWATVGIAPQLFNGDISVFNLKGFDETDDPSVQKVMKYFKQNNRTKKDRSIFYLIGWGSALAKHAAMTNAVDKNGWEGFNTKNVIWAMAHLKNFQPVGGLCDITYSKKRPTMRTARPYRIEGGVFTPLADFKEVPDLRPEKYR